MFFYFSMFEDIYFIEKYLFGNIGCLNVVVGFYDVLF